MINGEPKALFSVITLTDGMDEGDLWAQGSVAIGPDDYVGDVLPRSTDVVLDTRATLYPAILHGTARPYPQQTAGAT